MDDLLELLTYHRWATLRVLEATEALSPQDFARDLKSSHGGVRGTLAHLLGADAAWAGRLLGADPPFALPKEFTDVAALREPWLAVLDAYPDVLARLSPEDQIVYRNSAGPQQSSVAQIVRHVVNHGTHHRGQVVTMLRQLGAAAPNTDLIAFYRAR